MSASAMGLSSRVRAQLSDLLDEHERARKAGSGYTGLAQDIAALSTAVADLERAMAERRR